METGDGKGQDIAPPPDHRPATLPEQETPAEVVRKETDQDLPGEFHHGGTGQDLSGEIPGGGNDLVHRSLLVFREEAGQSLPCDFL